MAKPTAVYRVRGPLAELTLARIRELTREPEPVFRVFVFPILLTAILGIAFRSRPPEALPVAVVAGPLADARLAQGSNALDIDTGSIRVRGAGLGSDTTAFVHKVNTATNLCSANAAYTIIDNVYTNGTPLAMLQITPVEYYNGNTGASGTAFQGTSPPVHAYYANAGVCTAAAVWTIRRSDNTAHVNGAGYNVLVIRP
jgi:hypothetical protein